MEEVKVKVKSFLARFLKNVQIEDDQDFFALGFVNSLFAMQLVLFVEKEFGFSVEGADLDIDNFRSIHAITQLVERRRPTKEGMHAERD